MVHSSSTPDLEQVVEAFTSEITQILSIDKYAEYGNPYENHLRIAAIWQVLFPEREWTAGDVARAMIGLKLARSGQGYKDDTFIDLAGYSTLSVYFHEMETDE